MVDKEETIQIPKPLILSEEDFALVVDVFGAAIENSEQAFTDDVPGLKQEIVQEVKQNFARYRRIHGSLLKYKSQGTIMISEMWTKEFFDKLVAWAQKDDNDGK